jgi:hypothetical protein
MTFEDRHFSRIIAQEIEKQLIDLDLYDKLVTVTCDAAPNMRNIFTYFSRRNIQYINCVAHKLHLIVCNSLDLWVTLKKKQNTTRDQDINDDDIEEEDVEEDAQINLNQMIRTMSVDINEALNGNNDQNYRNNYASRVRFLSFICLSHIH